MIVCRIFWLLRKGNRAFTCLLLHMLTHTRTHLWFDGAVDGWGASGLHAAAAEGLGAGREGGVGDAVGHFVLQRWGALSVQLRALLHLGQGHTPSSFTAQHTLPHTTESHRRGGYDSPTCITPTPPPLPPLQSTRQSHLPSTGEICTTEAIWTSAETNFATIHF